MNYRAGERVIQQFNTIKLIDTSAKCTKVEYLDDGQCYDKINKKKAFILQTKVLIKESKLLTLSLV